MVTRSTSRDGAVSFWRDLQSPKLLQCNLLGEGLFASFFQVIVNLKHKMFKANFGLMTLLYFVIPVLQFLNTCC